MKIQMNRLGRVVMKIDRMTFILRPITRRIKLFIYAAAAGESGETDQKKVDELAVRYTLESYHTAGKFGWRKPDSSDHVLGLDMAVWSEDWYLDFAHVYLEALDDTVALFNTMDARREAGNLNFT